MGIYVGFDIGIKNLAFCAIDSDRWKEFLSGDSDDPGIVEWTNLDVVGAPHTCSGVIGSGKKKGEVCGKLAAWISDDAYYCGVHKPKTGKVKAYRPPRIKNLDMRTLKQRAFTMLDELQVLKDATCIAIETQPRKNQQMKMFAAAIEAYFIIRCRIDAPTRGPKIIGSPAKNKLKMYDGPPINTSHLKDPYDKRKYLAQRHTEYFLESAPEILQLYYLPSKKRDDLADAFLHCIMAI
jgi:hypothetical protein